MHIKDSMRGTNCHKMKTCEKSCYPDVGKLKNKTKKQVLLKRTMLIFFAQSLYSSCQWTIVHKGTEHLGSVSFCCLTPDGDICKEGEEIRGGKRRWRHWQCRQQQNNNSRDNYCNNNIRDNKKKTKTISSTTKKTITKKTITTTMTMTTMNKEVQIVMSGQFRNFPMFLFT